MRVMIACFLALVLVGCATAGREPNIAATRSGLVAGAEGDGVVFWKGIPFAQPPQGALRWRAPQPLSPWSGVRPAREHAHDCMQTPFARDAAPLGTAPSEDCLYLNVWRPAGVAADARLPVLVWIFGGGFVNGGASPSVYDGSALARQGVVFVSFNYRVGRFGFFAHPALTAANEDQGLLGNYGLMDQIAALQWVQDNIASFGGDPGNVTVFGESAGAASLSVLMTASGAQGLFHKAMAMSGPAPGFGGFWRPLHAEEGGDAEDAGLAFARWAGVQGDGPQAVRDLRALDAGLLAQGVVLGAPPLGPNDPPPPSGPMLDGVIAREQSEGAFGAGRMARMPFIAGATTADIPILAEDPFAVFGADAARARELYEAAAGQDLTTLRRVVGADRLMVEPARFQVAQMSAGGQRAYFYRAGYVPDTMAATWIAGLPHATEIPFFFDTLEARYPGQVSDADRRMAAQMSAYLVNFARSGDPNGAGLSHWPVYDGASRPVMEFTQAGARGGADPWRERLDLVEAAANR